MRIEWMVGPLLLTACREEPEPTEIRIAGALSMSGQLASQGWDMLRGAELAVRQVNTAGGLLGGRRLVLENFNDYATPEGAERAAHWILDEGGYAAIIGNVGSAFTIITADLAKDAGIPVVAPCAMATGITGFDDDGFLFRACPSDAYQCTLLANRALERGLVRVAIVEAGNSHGEGCADTFGAAFAGGGGTVVFRRVLEEGRSSQVELLEDVFATSPQAIMMPAYPFDAAVIVRDYNTHFFASDPVTFFFTMALANDDFVTGVGPRNFKFDHEGTAPTLRGTPQFPAFAEAYRERYDGPPTLFTPNAYDAAMAVALAIEAAGSTDGSAIRDELTRISRFDGHDLTHGASDVEAMLAAVRGGLDIDYQGVSGELDFDEHGDVPGADPAVFDFWQVRDDGVIEIQP